jgi:hypothetical protein
MVDGIKVGNDVLEHAYDTKGVLGQCKKLSIARVSQHSLSLTSLIAVHEGIIDCERVVAFPVVDELIVVNEGISNRRLRECRLKETSARRPCLCA